MTPVSGTQQNERDISRRKLMRKVAYTTPAVFAITAAPRTALGASGPRRRNNNGWGNGSEGGPAPGRSGNNPSPNTKDKANNRGR